MGGELKGGVRLSTTLESSIEPREVPYQPGR